MKEKPFFIERANSDRSYTVVSRHSDYENALMALKRIKSRLRHEVWCVEWTNTSLGYMPMAWIN